jgi:hypothetical protein
MKEHDRYGEALTNFALREAIACAIRPPARQDGSPTFGVTSVRSIALSESSFAREAVCALNDRRRFIAAIAAAPPACRWRQWTITTPVIPGCKVHR